MTDLGAQDHAEAVEAVDGQYACLAEYRELTQAQHAAARVDDFDLVGILAERIDGIIVELEVVGRRLASLRRRLNAGAVDGPRARDVRQMLAGLAADGDGVLAGVRDLTAFLLAQRSRVGQELAGLEVAALGGSPYGSPDAERASLFDAVG